VDAMNKLAPEIANRDDLSLIVELVTAGSRVLDVGCGNGDLLAALSAHKSVDTRGLEISQEGVNACVARGLSAIQGDADTDLSIYPDKAFDFVILSQTIQATRNPKRVLEELLRIGQRVIVSFPNFGHWRVRLDLAFRGRMPVTSSLDQPWYSTPNIHLCTIKDFVALCDELGVHIDAAYARRKSHAPFVFSPHKSRANLLAEDAIFMLHSGAA